MDEAKLREVIAFYKQYFAKDTPIWKFPDNMAPSSPRHKMAHLHWMLYQMEKFLDEGRMDKANRWLGFIQGVLWDNCYFTIDDLKNLNRAVQSEKKQ